MKLNETQIAEACRVAELVYSGQLKKRDGARTLEAESGVNASYAGMLIDIYASLVNGQEFKRTTSSQAMRALLEQIQLSRGQSALANALGALESHIRYYEAHYETTMAQMREMLTDVRSSKASPPTMELVQRQLQASVERALSDSSQARRSRLAAAPAKPRTMVVQATVYLRNADVVAEVLLRANGTCERCRNSAPFLRAKDGTPYLEVHHKEKLANGGDDTVENAIALCPNCHRDLHFGRHAAGVIEGGRK